jgi:hypothetical protein
VFGKAARAGARTRVALDGMSAQPARPTEVVIPKLRAKRQLELEDVVQLLRSEVERLGSQSAFARAAGVDRAVVCKILRGRALLQPKILRALNVRMVFVLADNEPPRNPISRKGAQLLSRHLAKSARKRL